MSVQSIDMDLPCSEKVWEATTAAKWKEVLPEHDSNYTLLIMVRNLGNVEHVMLSKPYGFLSYFLSLHGLMAMCNDMLHFDNSSIYLNCVEIDQDDIAWDESRQQMTNQLESWKAMYDAFAMESIWNLQEEPLRLGFHRRGTSLFALYHTAHIVINCEIRHLQTAAGAKAFLGIRSLHQTTRKIAAGYAIG